MFVNLVSYSEKMLDSKVFWWKQNNNMVIFYSSIKVETSLSFEMNHVQLKGKS